MNTAVAERFKDRIVVMNVEIELRPAAFDLLRQMVDSDAFQLIHIDRVIQLVETARQSDVSAKAFGQIIFAAVERQRTAGDLDLVKAADIIV